MGRTDASTLHLLTAAQGFMNYLKALGMSNVGNLPGLSSVFGETIGTCRLPSGVSKNTKPAGRGETHKGLMQTGLRKADREPQGGSRPATQGAGREGGGAPERRPAEQLASL